jgi:hypothetical protein
MVPRGMQSPVPPIRRGLGPPGASTETLVVVKLVQIPCRSGSPHGVRAGEYGACPLTEMVAARISATRHAAPPPADATERSFIASLQFRFGARPPTQRELGPATPGTLQRTAFTGYPGPAGLGGGSL